MAELFGRHTLFHRQQGVIPIDYLNACRHHLAYLHALFSSVIGLRLHCCGAGLPASRAKAMPAVGEQRAPCTAALAPGSAGAPWEPIACADTLSHARDKVSCSASYRSYKRDPCG